MDVEALTPSQRDALREVGSIGAGHAATALSQLVDHAITLEVPRVDMISVREVPYVFGGPERLAFAVNARLVGDLGGSIVFMADHTAGLNFLDLLQGRPAGTTVAETTEDAALLKHACMLLISAYLAAISRMAGIQVMPGESAYACDMAGALLESILSGIETPAEKAILLRTVLIDETFATDVGLFFLPDPTSLAVLLGRLGVA